MAYSQQQHFYGHPPQQAFPYLGQQLPTPTPTHGGSTHSDEYIQSPPVRAHFQSSHVDHLPLSLLTPTQDPSYVYEAPYDIYFDSNNGAGLPTPPTPISQPQHKLSPNNNPMSILEPYTDPKDNVSNSDDETMTTAQKRRKAQNRAAQRAFRERKDRHVKTLEAKLANLEKNSAGVSEENERLKLQIQKVETENEILRVRSEQPHRGDSEPLPNAGPMKYSPTDFYTDVLYAHDNKTPSHRIVLSENGEKLLAAGATWDYIIKHPLYLQGMVDVGDVSDRLKRVAKCDGQGPVFEERAILEAIQRSVASGSDELL